MEPIQIWGLSLEQLAAPIYVLCMLAEVAITRKQGHPEHEAKDSFASIGMGLGSVVLSLIWLVPVAWLLDFSWSLRITDLGVGWWQWIVVMIAVDFLYYWFHRMSHEVRFLWASHVIHHSSRRYNLATAVRQSWTAHFATLIFYLPLVFLGFHPVLVFAAKSINLIYQFFIHTELVRKMGWLEWVLNTPSHHRVHHGTNIQYLDRNYGGILIIWDRLFGSFEPEVEKVEYGILKNIESHNPLYIATHEWIALFRSAFGHLKSGSIKNAIKTFLMPPGWSPDGSTITAHEMQARWNRGEDPKSLTAV